LSSGTLENLSGDQIEEELHRHTDQIEIAARLEELKKQSKKGESA